MSSRNKPVAKTRTKHGISMRFIICAATVALIVASLSSFGLLAERNTRSALTAEVETRLLVEARNLASVSVDALLSDFPELILCPLVREIEKDRSDLAFAIVLDHDGIIQGHVDLEALNSELTLLDDLDPALGSVVHGDGEKILGNSVLLVVSVPAKHANGRLVGTALVGLKKSYLNGIMARQRLSFLLLTIGLLVVGTISALLLMSHLLRPITTIRSGLERIGQGKLDTIIKLRTKSELGQLAETINSMAHQLKTSQSEMLEKERLDHEMDLARQIQQSLLPGGALRVGDYLCLGANRAAAEVGGDYYDLFELPDGKVGIVIADVSGKGLGGCLVAAMLAVLLRSLREKHTSPSELLVTLEHEVKFSLAQGTFVTIFYGILDPATGRMVYASAAHSPLFIYRAESGLVETHKTKGIPLGAVRNGMLAKTLQDYTIDLQPGDLLLQYTDGLNEAWNPDLKEQFGFEQIELLICEHSQDGLPKLMNVLCEEAMAWSTPDPLGDDLTLVAVSRAPAAVPCSPTKTSPPEFMSGNLAARQALAEMLGDIAHISIPADLANLKDLRPWVDGNPDLGELPSDQRLLIESSLFEVCANIIEHGYQNDPSQVVDVWWRPVKFNTRQLPTGIPVPQTSSRQEQGNETSGYFLIRDDAKAFDPGSWTPPQLEDESTRRRGRGLGLKIVHSLTKKIEQIPGTPAGNITLLRFAPSERHTDKETQNV